MMRLLYPPWVGGRGALGLLVLRVVLGAAFMLHGWPKIQNATTWMPPNVVLPRLHEPVPGPLQAAAAVSEFVGGALLILGLLTPLAALGLLGTMAGALAMFHIPRGDPFVGGPGQSSAEAAAVYLAAALMFLLVGPGTLSVDALWARRPAPPGV
jgi:putative oxidoreductase